MSKTAALIYGLYAHYIDHLAPLCDILEIPLIVTEKSIENTIHVFYPSVDLHYIDYIEAPEAIVANLDTLFVCTPKALFEEVFYPFQRLLRKKVETIWCPHGNSDKGHIAPYMEALKEEDTLLVYGQKMIRFLKEKKALEHHPLLIKVGNFRKIYSEKNKQFYSGLVQEKILSHFSKKKKIILYAPTWQDSESSSSFHEALPHLIKNLPEKYNLLIKPHPNLLHNPETEKLIELYKEKKNVLFLVDFPPIYPILEISDLYIGDLSSIGYDFLALDHPMFFLNQQNRNANSDPGLFLYQCGKSISPNEYPNLYQIIEKSLPLDQALFSKTREKIYRDTFEEGISIEDLQKKIGDFL
jgi:hypothetical protein